MNPIKLTIQIFHQGAWHDAAELTLQQPQLGRSGPARLGYDFDYALEWLQRDDEHACSLVLPIELMVPHDSPTWFGFLDDIMPAGAARRYWVNQLGLSNATPERQDTELLCRGTIAPVGNLRIKEALPELPAGSTLRQRRFAIQEVVERNTDFLEYAQQMGAASGGATGAGGEAPKLLLRCSANDEVWIDTFQDDVHNPDTHYLVKFPRNNRGPIDCDILRAEYHYYHELQSLGVSTISTNGMRLLEGERFPSLWLPRFDVAMCEGQLTRYGLESVYSVLHKAPGSYLKHQHTLRSLIRLLEHQYRVLELGESFDRQAFVIEWVKRDLLNVAFGNSDNHGRNTALLKTPEKIWLAPVYDFAPMKADPEMVPRSTSWGSPLEEGGQYNWRAIANELADLAEPARVLAELKALAGKLAGLKQRLQARGVPESILNMPAMGFDYLDDKLKRWELL
ncbi:type II toxin-antitoxin system HipA family toxin [Zobellella taiwanensis]|jgi:serine/threonine-protein kinase HipA|uniref:Toxin HipA n=1 Tax=Zobellella taiwanensis TaxID=347535 RepID=A0A2P7RDS5_9GAMM|nr:HipA domain-containing protein [Zobellella taiwanensis]PSJ48377.1 toxin HipA [Zobellella taiwanensis]